MTQVVDASLVVKWFVRDRERGLSAADEVLTDVIADPRRFSAPILLWYEVHAVFCRRLPTAHDCVQNLKALWALDMEIVVPDETLMVHASRLAQKHKLTGYDAQYAALAQIRGGTWLTFDEAAYKRVSGLGIARLLENR